MADREKSRAYHAHIDSSHRLLDFKLREIWEYRDLVWLYTRKDLVRRYKQTILGPLWIIINPIITSLIYVFLFGGIAGLSTDGVPQILFYMAGNSIWTFLASSVNRTSYTFLNNSNVFGKVYFPRLAIPASYVLTAVIEYFVHVLILIVLCVAYSFSGRIAIPYAKWLLIPLILIWLGCLGTGIGLIIASTTAKYRDLIYLLTFILNRWMYATPVVYPLSSAMERGRFIRFVMMANPATAPIEIYRSFVLGVGGVSTGAVIYSLAFAVIVLAVGIILFNRVERTFIDTI